MKSPNNQNNQGPNPTLPQGGIFLGRNHEEGTDYLIALGMASAALLHRLHNTIGVLRPNLVRLRKRLDIYVNSNDKDDFDKAIEIIYVMDRVLRSTAALTDAVEMLRSSSDLPKPVDVNSLLYEVWEELSASCTSKTVRLSFDLPENVPLVRADSHLLTEVFRAVIENSLEAIDEETGRVEIRSRYKRANNVVQIEIEDNGTGIPQQILSRLFQGPITSTASNKGLGLWLTRLILAKFEGNIRVQHTKIGHGTTMAITLPAIQAIETPVDRNHD